MITEIDKQFVKLAEIREVFRDNASHKLLEGYRLIASAEDKQGLLDKFGTDAAQFFIDFESARQLLVSMGATNLPEPTGEFEINPDGTVTFTAAPEPEPQAPPWEEPAE